MCAPPQAYGGTTTCHPPPPPSACAHLPRPPPACPPLPPHRCPLLVSPHPARRSRAAHCHPRRALLPRVVPHRHPRTAHPPQCRLSRPPACLPLPPGTAGPICPYSPARFFCPSDPNGGGAGATCLISAPAVWHPCVAALLPKGAVFGRLACMLGWVGKQHCRMRQCVCLFYVGWLPMLWDMAVGHASWSGLVNGATGYACSACMFGRVDRKCRCIWVFGTQCITR